jgi:hypothetical protein
MPSLPSWRTFRMYNLPWSIPRSKRILMPPSETLRSHTNPSQRSYHRNTLPTRARPSTS